MRLEKERIRVRARYLRNKESILARGKIYREENHDKRRDAVRKSDLKHRSKIRANQRARYSANPEKAKAYQKSILPRIRAQRAIRRERDVNYRIKLNLSSRLHAAVKRVKSNKCDKTRAMVGCDLSLLKLHLQAQFKPGMTWENYGDWHIDHIIPCAEFDLREPFQQLRCFHYSNLQPLWAVENLSKGRKLATIK
jgi:hypothetical protein